MRKILPATFLLVPKLQLGNPTVQPNATRNPGSQAGTWQPGVPRGVLLAVLCLFLVNLSGMASGDAVEKVRQGVAHFRAGDYEKAAGAFADADVARPDDDRIAFDRACAYAARGDTQKAAELFRSAAMSREAELSAACHYNLGSLRGAEARATFGENPEEAAVEVRHEGLALLNRAVGHYRDCLELEPDHVDARHNLEVIRLWIKHMEALWEQRDRQKQRDELGLLEFLQMIETQERMLRSTAQSLDAEPDSPKRRQAFSTTETSQMKLAEEIEPLKKKIAEAFQAPQQPAGAAPGMAQAGPPQAGAVQTPPSDEAVDLLQQLADEAHRAMQSAADRLDGDSVSRAIEFQAEAVEKLDQIYMAAVPFPDLIGRGVATEEGLVEQVAPFVELPDEESRPELDAAETAWNQRFVAGWGQILPAKAEHEMKNLENMDPAALAGAMNQPPTGHPPTGHPPTGHPPDPAAAEKQAEKQQEQIDQLKAAMEKAIELGPQIGSLADEAAGLLEEDKPAEALPKQEETLKLLKEIADLLPKQDQQQQGDQPQDDQQDDDDQQQQDQQQQSDQQQQQQPRPEDLSKQQAESVLRKVRDRNRDRRDLEKQLQQYLYRGGAVERDW